MPSPKILSSAAADWQTPPELLDLVRQVGPIALDPCTTASNPVGADRFFTPTSDGLGRPWATDDDGLVWVNPPYNDLASWAAKCAEEAERGAEILLLCPPRTETTAFQESILSAAALLFWAGWNGAPCDRWPCVTPEERPPAALRRSRLSFVDPATGRATGGNTTASLIAYWGWRPGKFRRVFGRFGWVVAP